MSVLRPLLIAALVVTEVDDPLSVGAYAVGVGIGVLLGLVAGERLTPGTIGVTIITSEPEVAAGLWARDWDATVQTGHAEHGPVMVLSSPSTVATSTACIAT